MKGVIIIMEIHNLTWNLSVFNKGKYIDAVALCCIPSSSPLELMFHGREIKLGSYKFFASSSKKLEVDILGIRFHFDGYVNLYDKSQDVCLGDEFSRYPAGFYGVENDAPIKAVLLAGVNKDLPLNEEVKAVIVQFLIELYHYFYGRGYELYEKKE